MIDPTPPAVDFITRVDQIFAENPKQYQENACKLMSDMRAEIGDESMSSLPLAFSSVPSPHGCLVRARAMIQDVRGPEIFGLVCNVREDETSDSGEANELAMTGLFRDTFGDKEIKSVVEHSSRHCYLMVPVPAETTWSTRRFTGNADTSSDIPVKKSKLEMSATSTMECFVGKFFSDLAEDLRVNSVVDVWGWLAPPHNMDDGLETGSDTNVANVRNLHVLEFSPVKEEKVFMDPADEKAALAACVSVLESVLGDDTAAQYLLLNMISTTFSRPGGMPICSLPLNLCGLSRADELVTLVSEFLPKVKSLRLTPELLSQKPFAAVKNYENDRLAQGELQLSAGTHLVVDESGLPDGKVPVEGFAEKNLQALGQLLVDQRLSYDYQFYPVMFDHDVPIVIVSKGESRLLKTPFRCAVPGGSPSTSPLSALTALDIEKIRLALLSAKQRLRSITITKDVAEQLQTSFCEWAKQLTAEDDKAESLNQLLVLSRLIAAASGETCVSMDSWDRALFLEKTRQETLTEWNKSKLTHPVTSSQFYSRDL